MTASIEVSIVTAGRVQDVQFVLDLPPTMSSKNACIEPIHDMFDGDSVQ